jgi:hypothetical protein
MNIGDNTQTTERVPSVGSSEAQPTADTSVPTEKIHEAASVCTEEKQECEKTDALNKLMSSVKINTPDMHEPTGTSPPPAEPSNESHEKRARFASVVANRAFFHLATSILENQPVLNFLQQRYRIFELLPNNDGVWFVVMSVESAVRFLNGIEQELFRGNIVNRFIADAEAIDGAAPKPAVLFNWKESVFYATADYIRRFEDAKTIFEATVGHANLSDDVAAMRADFYERYRALTIMQPDDLDEAVACMTRRDKSRQIAVNLMVVDPAYDLCGSHVFKYDVALTASDRLLYLKHLAVRYMITMRDTELILAHESGAAAPMSREESREVRNAILSYATAVLYENEFVNPEDLGSDIGLMSRACTAPVAICGYCAKRCSNDVRCKRCFLFRYCSCECRTRHLNDGVEGTRETAAPGSLVVTHAHLCGLSRALGVFWTQFPPDLDQLDFVRITKASQQTFSEFALNPENTKVEFEEIQPSVSEEKPATVQS